MGTGFPIKAPDLSSKELLGPVPLGRRECHPGAEFLNPPPSCVPSGFLLVLDGVWLLTLPTPSTAKSGWRILSGPVMELAGVSPVKR